ncbi:hypothetical protein QX216_18575 [Vibrio parahaemolyticus]|uniref:hypothetical protein n=1 Tax=Vibrio parahaemolyticus TaxID=670 RepID=UPI0028796C5E|nr:hypothetical protein [Vibrio parahaemolyticus]MDS1795610.1 hypothetical protein [Vibrio parahaemolyticus]MDS1944094.1 hypothetical protein [Vibrio parahaemolyticus]
MKNLNQQKVSNFVNSLYCSTGAYKFSPHSEEYNSLSTCFALLTFEVLGETPFNLKVSLDYLQDFQDKDSGLFIDTTILDKLKGTHNIEYINHQVTYHILMVFDAFGISSKFDLNFLEEYKSEVYLNKWLESLNWKNPWLISNNVMFILNFLIHQNEVENKKYIDYILDWLDENQSNENGMWNLGHKSTLHNQMAGAFHFQYFFDYFKRKKNNTNLIVDNTLLIQDYDGLFSYASGGGSCDDLDGIDLLCRNYHDVDEYRKDKIIKALMKAKASLLVNQNNDGGFCWAKRTKFNFKNVIHMIPIRLILAKENLDAKRSFIMKVKNIIATIFFKKKLKWQFSGIDKCSIMIDESDIFSTWFRLLSISMIDKVINNEPLKIRSKIGIGYLK